MIREQSYTPAWVETFRRQRQYRNVNPALFERMIYAFSLVESLATTGLNFIFKGGTSLMLMPVNSMRFSIDVDIITSEEKKQVEVALNRLIGNSVFSSFKEDVSRSRKGGLDKAHYVFDYKSFVNRFGTILLDVLFEENPYFTLNNAEIRNPWIDTTEPYFPVTIPSVNSILGDKLTAFAPTTSGIPYWLGESGKPDKRIEIIKQLCDISKLIDLCSDPIETKNVFRTIASRQIDYRFLKLDTDDIIEDIFETALILARRERNKAEPGLSRFADLQNGLIMFGGYLITGSFRIEEAITASAKVACFTQAFRNDHSFQFELFVEKTDMDGWNITHPEYNFLNRLKKTNKSAFFYWYNCLLMRNLID